MPPFPFYEVALENKANAKWTSFFCVKYLIFLCLSFDLKVVFKRRMKFGTKRQNFESL
jgi:hypothetical protein